MSKSFLKSTVALALLLTSQISFADDNSTAQTAPKQEASSMDSAATHHHRKNGSSEDTAMKKGPAKNEAEGYSTGGTSKVNNE